MKPCNIVYIHSHDTGRYIQPYGHAVHTPNLQKLAEQGVLFRQAFNAGPTCSPSRGALLTGQCSHSNGLIGLTGFGFALRDPQEHLSHFMKAQGYETALAGIQHEATPEELGYDQILPMGQPLHPKDEDLDATLEFIRKPHDGPFFLTVGFFDTHRPFPKHDPTLDDPRYITPPAPLPDTPTIRQDMADYHASVRRLDHRMGKVFNAIEQAGLSDNTIIICTTDHGLAFPHMKCNLTDHGIGVMLILKGPQGLSGGKVIEGMVSHTDLFPTLCEWIDVPGPDYLQGQSIMPLVRGEQEEIHDAIFAETNYHVSYEPARCIRTPRYKYIRRFHDFPTPILPNCDDCPSKIVLCEQNWAQEIQPRECLYDLLLDPNETSNLAAQSDMQETLSQLRSRLEQWMKQTGDPLLEGPMPLPQGAKHMPADTYSSLD